ncbi:isochorismatase family cysteine hydrolase [Variovorax rhizosphaerae]|uniref:Isochorismatase family cysteine hydrolase n=1 Tax=Variovorax rhizosphaerae TaxID=1836200 RepID=A0ABU8WZ14_9BURK
MPDSQSTTEPTALLLVDPYNDFLSENGKLQARAKAVMEEVGTIAHMRDAVAACRAAGVTVFYVPHHRARPSDFSHWAHPTPYQLGAHRIQLFAEGTWGAEWHPDFQPQPEDVMIKEHRGSSGFANTDLDIQLRQHGIRRLILIGMLANTCLETTGKFAMELGYHVTLVRDATAAFSMEAMKVAHEINGPTYAHAIVTTAELVTGLSASGGAA